VVLDARLGFEIKEGYAITFLFAVDEVIANWAKIVLPYSERLVEKVSNMKKESRKIGLNFTFEPSPRSRGAGSHHHGS
jgi:alpha-glucuronidase